MVYLRSKATMNTISDKQLEANQHNALKGGVKTDEGKAVVRFNARKHGILANLVAEYENDFYQSYLDQLFDEFQPESIIENILVERIALHYLKLFRLTKAETEFMQSCLHPANLLSNSLLSLTDRDCIPTIRQQHVQQLIEIYGRYETATENRLYRAVRELKEYRHSRS
jgi:hypothetical protein